MNVIMKDDYTELCVYAAEQIADFIRENKDSLICLAAGDTMLGIYDYLIRLNNQGKVNLSDAYYLSLDEWVGAGYETKGSCRQVMFDNFYIPARIPEEKIKFFNGHCEDTEAECNRITDYILSHGKIGLSVLGVGLNGHVGFNEPYARRGKSCVTVELDEVTKKVSSKYFGQETEIDKGITVSVDELLNSRKILVILNGEKKAQILYKTLKDDPSMAVPSTLFRLSDNCTFIVDKAAANML